MSANRYPLPVKFARSLAYVIALKRISIFAASNEDQTDSNQPKLPGKNWATAFYQRHSELKAATLKALDWEQHDHNIYDKCVQWFIVIGKELASLLVRRENTYNMDETGVLLSVLNCLKVLVSAIDIQNYCSAGVKRTLITAIKYISADSRSLHPMVIWPAATHRAN
jgi:hypothetical protein